MKKFWTYITNKQYAVGCSDRAVYLYDHTGAKLARFKDIPYGCDAAFSPVDNTFVVKSTGAYFAVYSADERALLHKIKFSDVNGSQDDGFCFSPDGTCFINIERQKRSTNSCISVYETKNYTCLGKMYEDHDRIEPKWIEFGEDQVPYVLGFTRREDRVMDAAFIARLGRSGLEDMRIITEEEFEFFTDFKRLEMQGFTEEAKQWSGFRYRNVDMTGMEQESHPFKDLWERYGQIQGS